MVGQGETDGGETQRSDGYCGKPSRVLLISSAEVRPVFDALASHIVGVGEIVDCGRALLIGLRQEL